MLAKGMQVCFSDFNAEVIDQVTVPNVRLNVDERHWRLAEYYSGDWGSLSPLLDEVTTDSCYSSTTTPDDGVFSKREAA